MDGIRIDPGRNALVVVDLQRGFDDPSWGPRDNPACEENIGALVDAWRAAGGAVVLVRHDSTEPGSPLQRGTPGNELRDAVAGAGDVLVTKEVNSAFHGDPDLAAWLRERGLDGITVCGVTTNHCCETTARVGSNLGFETVFVIDATHAFDRRALDGTTIPAAEMSRVTAANLDDEFATVLTTAEAISAIAPA